MSSGLFWIKIDFMNYLEFNSESSEALTATAIMKVFHQIYLWLYRNFNLISLCSVEACIA